MCLGGLVKGLRLGLYDRYLEARAKRARHAGAGEAADSKASRFLDLQALVAKAVQGFSDHNVVPKLSVPSSSLNSGELRALFRSTLMLKKPDMDASLSFSPGNHWGLTDEVFSNSMNARFYDYLDYGNLMYVLSFAEEKGIDTSRIAGA